MVSFCPICGKPVYFGEKKRSLGRDYHPLCLKCHKCKRQLTPGQHAEHDEKPFCTNCFMRDFGPRGNRGPAVIRTYTASSWKRSFSLERNTQHFHLQEQQQQHTQTFFILRPTTNHWKVFPSWSLLTTELHTTPSSYSHSSETHKNRRNNLPNIHPCWHSHLLHELFSLFIYSYATSYSRIQNYKCSVM